jgi:potassium-dependent mechanosensitive channel
MKMGDRVQRLAKSLSAVALVVFFLPATAPGGSFGRTPEEMQHSIMPPTTAAIAPEEVAARSEEVANVLLTLSEKLAFSPEIEKIQQALPEFSRQINLDAAETKAIVGGQPPLAILEAQRTLWQRRHLQVSTWLALLTQRGVALQVALDRLSQMKATWTQTLAAAQAGQAPQVVLGQIETTLDSIEAAQPPLKGWEKTVLMLQADMAAIQARCDNMLQQILKARIVAVQGILVRDSLPVWSHALWSRTLTVLPNNLRDIARTVQTNIWEYVRNPSRGMPLHAALLLALTMATCAARRKKRLWKDGGVGVSAVVKVFDRPYSAALIIVLLAATAVNSPAPALVKGILAVLALVPMIRLVRPVIDPRLASAVFTVAILYAVDFLRQILGGGPLVEQALLILESLAAILVLRWLLQSGCLKHDPGQAQVGRCAHWLPPLAKFLIVGLSAGGIAAALGFMRLARLTGPAAISGGVLALSLYAYVRVAGGAAVIALKSPTLQRLQMVRNHSDRIQKWINRLLVWTAIFFWTNRSLEYIGMLDPVLSAGSVILGLRLQRGSISISVEDILAFGLTVLAAFLLSAFIRFTLREEVYPRRGVPRGLSYAYSRLVHYVILAFGFLVGLGVLGMDLTRVTVMAGAFGVGIGFGLQNVVNNFVCGLILLFERPVHVGDIIEVEDLQGEVRRIGIRSSTVRTLQGADIIVPNAQFITASVTNWTFSDPLRRIDLPVGVNYGAAPQAVIELLEKTAREHPAVLVTPAPKGLFIGYGDSSINFELRAWTDQSINWAAIRSELASAVYDAVYAAGMAFPFPQREVHVLGNAAAAKTVDFSPVGGVETMQEEN